jgi:hypothetical protein
MIVTGSLETQIELVHKHLAKYTAHSNADWRQKSVTGAIWEKDYLRRNNKLKRALYGNGNAASEEQRKAYELLFGSEEFKARNVCLVGIPASGKTWISKKLSKLLQCIFFQPEEVLRCAPLGRVACNFHPDARTIHHTLQLRPNGQNRYPESLADLSTHLKALPQQTLTQLKAVIATEAFMCTGPHLEALLTHIKKANPNCIFLFDGDSLQVTTKATPGYPSQAFLTRQAFENVCPETQIIVLEKSTNHRIKNLTKLHHLGLMRLGKATEATVAFFKEVRIPHRPHPVLRLFANSSPAAKFNDEKLTATIKSNPSAKLVQLFAKDTLKGTTTAAKMTDSEEHSLAADSIIKVVQGAPILIVQNHMAEILYERDKPGHKVYLGNGTTGVFWTYEKDLDAIVAKVQLASKEVFVRIKRRDFSTTTKLRSQFPIMLAWAATIHKVQGMEFEFLEVDFCLDTLSNSGQNEFYQGLAYMVLSRAETVVVVGRLTLALLNNVNLESLAWWNSQIEIWNSFKSKSRATPEKQFRNAIHMHNWHAAAAQRSCQAIVAAQKDVPAPNPVPGLAPVRSVSPVSDPVPVPALALSRVSDPAPPLGSAPAPAPDDGHAQRPVHTRPPATNPNLALSKHPVPGFSSSSSAPKRPADTLPTDPEPKLKKRQIVQNVVRAAWNTKTKDWSSRCRPTLQTLAQVLSETKDRIGIPTVFRCSHAGHADTHGEAMPALIKHMMQQYGQLVSEETEKKSAFVDLGSGHGGLVCQMASFRKFHT